MLILRCDGGIPRARPAAPTVADRSTAACADRQQRVGGRSAGFVFGGGGGGGCLEETLTISGFDTVSITVGAGGKGAKRTNGADTLLQFQRTPKHNLRAYGGGAGGLTRKGGAKGGSGGGHGRDSGPKKGNQ